MSYERAFRAIHQKKTDRIPQMEFLAHPGFVREITGIDPYQYPRESFAQAYESLEMDIVVTLPKSVLERGPGSTKKVEWGLEGAYSPEVSISSHEEVLDHDPAARWPQFLADMSDYQETQEIMGTSALVPAYTWLTLIHWGTIFDKWELFLEAIYLYPSEFKKKLREYAEVSRAVAEEWTKLDPVLFISHDDIAMTRGPIFSPSWLRENVFPYYSLIWEPLRAKGVKILFISDGDISEFVDDLVQAGADGLVVEPMVDIQALREKYPDVVIIGNVDTKVLTFGGCKEIEDEVVRCIRESRGAPGYFLNVSGAIPQNIPLENVRAYFESCSTHRRK